MNLMNTTTIRTTTILLTVLLVEIIIHDGTGVNAMVLITVMAMAMVINAVLAGIMI